MHPCSVAGSASTGSPGRWCEEAEMCVHREKDCQEGRLLSSDTFPPRVAHSWLGRLLWPPPGLCLTPTAQPHSWARGPSTSLISDLLICMLPFGVLGMVSSCSAPPCSPCSVLTLGLLLGNPLPKSLLSKTPGETCDPCVPSIRASRSDCAAGAFQLGCSG